METTKHKLTLDKGFLNAASVFRVAQAREGISDVLSSAKTKHHHQS